MKHSTCPFLGGNDFCKSAEVITYHDWNTNYSVGCYFCKQPAWTEKLEDKIADAIFCNCDRCEKCGKLVK